MVRKRSGTINWQNIPRDDKTVKRAVLPKRGALSFFDYKQIEPRLTAYFLEKKGHPEFAEQIRAGVGPYEAVARLSTGKTELTEQERDVWKRIFLAILYGAGVDRVKDVWVEETGEVITRAQAKAIVDTFKKNWPAVPALQKDVQKIVKQRGYLRGLDGRHLHLEEYGEHKLLNKLIQGSAAGIMKRALLNVHRELRTATAPLGPSNKFVGRPKSRMVSVIHDELIIDGPEHELEWLHEVVPPLMRQGFEHVHEVVPILVDHEVSTTNWADKVGYDEWKESVGNSHRIAA